MRERLTVILPCMITLVALVVAGCSEASSGTPVPDDDATTKTEASSGSSPRSSTPGSTGQYRAPRVADPLDATRYFAEPCAALSPRLLQSLGLPAEGEPMTTGALGDAAPRCEWRTGSELASVGFLKANRNGLDDLYRQHEVFQDHKYWEETTVEGHPGVFHSTLDNRSDGDCALAVGLSDTLAMLVSESGQLGAASCQRAKDIAAAVVKTLKGEG